MANNHNEIAHELAKLASLMAPGGVEDGIGADDAFAVQDNSGRQLEIHNKNFNTHRLGQEMGLGGVLPEEDWNPPSLAEVEERARRVYGDQSHNSDFYTEKSIDEAMNALLMGRPAVVASRRKLDKLAAKYGAEIELITDIAQELARFASLSAPGIEDTIGQKRNEGPSIQDRIDSNKSLGSVKSVFRHEPTPEVTSYGAPAFVPSMDTGGFEGAMEVHATRRKAGLNKKSWFDGHIGLFTSQFSKDPEALVQVAKDKVFAPGFLKDLIQRVVDANPASRELFEKHGLIPAQGPNKEAATRRLAQKKTL